jgi:hypothetical protein
MLKTCAIIRIPFHFFFLFFSFLKVPNDVLFSFNINCFTKKLFYYILYLALKFDEAKIGTTTTTSKGTCNH